MDTVIIILAFVALIQSQIALVLAILSYNKKPPTPQVLNLKEEEEDLPKNIKLPLESMSWQEHEKMFREMVG
jgi:hypothetical protein